MSFAPPPATAGFVETIGLNQSDRPYASEVPAKAPRSQILLLLVGNFAEIAEVLRGPWPIKREKQIATIAFSSIVYRFFEYF